MRDQRGLRLSHVAQRREEALGRRDELAASGELDGLLKSLASFNATLRVVDAAKAAVVDERSAIALMSAQPTLIKRPVVEAGRDVLVGFTEDGYASRFARR